MSNYYKELELFENFKLITNRYAKSLSENQSGCFHHRFESLLDNCLITYSNKIAFTNKALNFINNLDYNGDIKEFLNLSAKSRLFPNENILIEIPNSLKKVVLDNSKSDEAMIQGDKNYHIELEYQKEKTELINEIKENPLQYLNDCKSFIIDLEISINDNSIKADELFKEIMAIKDVYNDNLMKPCKSYIKSELSYTENTDTELLKGIEKPLNITYTSIKKIKELLQNSTISFDINGNITSIQKYYLSSIINFEHFYSWTKTIINKALEENKKTEENNTLETENINRVNKNPETETTNIDKKNNAIKELKKVWLANPKLSIEEFLQKGINKSIWNEDYTITSTRKTPLSKGKTCLSAISNALKDYAIPKNINHNILGEAFCKAFNVEEKPTTKDRYKTFSTPTRKIVQEARKQFNIKY